MKCKAVFFDLDGVLVDSERVEQEIFHDFLKKINSTLPPERFYCTIGAHPSINVWSQILDGYDLGMTETEFRSVYRTYRREAFARIKLADRIFPEVLEFLKYLKETDHYIACASSSSMPYIRTILEEGNIFCYFDLLVSCDDFPHSKPAPDIYLYCLEKSGLSPESCVVVEDSVYGIVAGKRAGMYVCARRDRQFGIDQSKADRLFDDLNELKSIL